MFDKNLVQVSFKIFSDDLYKVGNKCLSNLDDLLVSSHNGKVKFEFASKEVNVGINNSFNAMTWLSGVNIHKKFSL